ncbi:wax ester/triacylglycerol synthase domain-containing protein [Streptomyces sp. DHE17-7]|uniref:wax ester/triacylglycerol synthase domain-containing protein n=1 Tax=Streptomyces sp. DHE17-7 TaxID=2759949 RepID=UPI0022EA6DFC|nr:wax ester/triacylglycerol synthase domain-containing protein [Streptomyces sp. DHE17-7]MBJ6618549.1 hypothetical protein [Streptomyces sp. DHE17-7]
MTRPHPGTDGRLPPSLAMGTADVAFHLAAGGRPLPVVFAFGFEGRAPTLDSVRARVAERVHRVPTSRYRIARDRRRFRRVDRIEADRHVHEAWLPEDTDGSATGRLMLSRPLATDDRPAWDVWLVHGPAGRHTLVYRTDHAYQDGVGAAWTARASSATTRAADPFHAPPPAPPRAVWPTPWPRWRLPSVHPPPNRPSTGSRPAASTCATPGPRWPGSAPSPAPTAAR